MTAALALGFAVVASTASPAWAVAPANDNFANAQAHTASFADSVSTVDATTEGSEPDPSCSSTPVPSIAYKTVWYSLTLSAATTVTADTAASNFDTVLTVYTGAGLGSLTEIACNDDGISPGGASTLSFSASASTTYWIRVGGWNDGFGPQPYSQGTAVLNAQALPACTITGTSGNDTLNGTSGNDVICGLEGNDTINGGNGNDIISAGFGDDIVDGGNGTDTLYGDYGDDAMGGGNGADTLFGGPGADTNDGETLLGGLLHLFDNGSDTIDGGPGDDDLDGQNGDDTLIDHTGTDTMSGNLGNDNIDVQDGVSGDTASGGLGSDTCTVDAGDSTSSC
ncbi:calcium-binding protein [Nonomuraea sp. NPDC050404]|uniref:calcium-binding protein n=1 Tax=Nonomuraea sp. NPDC050404 TaxID=3155783 RepID=UPI0033E0DD98